MYGPYMSPSPVWSPHLSCSPCHFYAMPNWCGFILRKKNKTSLKNLKWSSHMIQQFYFLVLTQKNWKEGPKVATCPSMFFFLCVCHSPDYAPPPCYLLVRCICILVSPLLDLSLPLTPTLPRVWSSDVSQSLSFCSSYSINEWEHVTFICLAYFI